MSPSGKQTLHGLFVIWETCLGNNVDHLQETMDNKMNKSILFSMRKHDQGQHSLVCPEQNLLVLDLPPTNILQCSLEKI